MQALTRTAIVSGLAAAICLLMVSLGMHYVGVNPFGPFRHGDIAIYAIFFILGMIYYRDKLNAFRLRPQTALGLGFLINFVAAPFNAFLLYQSMIYLAPEMLQNHIDAVLSMLNQGEALLRENWGDAAFEERYLSMQELTPRTQALDQMLWLMGKGLFNTFLFMLILKN